MGIKVACQIRNGIPHPFSEEAREELSRFKENQIISGVFTGIMKERSVPQHRLFFACMRAVADNTDDSEWSDVDKVKIQLKHLLRFYKSIHVLPCGTVHCELGSFSFSNLNQIHANKIVDRSLPILAKKIGLSEQELVKNAQEYYMRR